jgi:hypothetical protein
LKCKAFAFKDIKAVFTEGFNGYYFIFPSKIINEVVDYLQRKKAHGQQDFVNRIFNLRPNNQTVELYGYVDYLGLDCVIDLKTTADYTFPKYRNNWQRYVYGYCLKDTVSEVEFLCVEFPSTKSKQKTEPEIYTEQYPFDEELDIFDLCNVLNNFIGFLEENRDKITDKKIFGGDSQTADCCPLSASDRKNKNLQEPTVEIKLYQINNSEVSNE